jgi:putative inorganic carbon (HCO3(-)) transporter
VVVPKKLNFIWLMAAFLAAIYYFFGIKFFVAGLVGVCGFVMVIYDVKIGLFGAAFLYPFLPDAAGLIMLLSMGFFVLIRSILFKEKIEVMDITLPIGLFGFVAIFATITSIEPMGSLRDLALNAAGLSFVFAMTNTIKKKSELNAFISVFLVSALLVGLIGIYQRFTGVEMRPEWLDVENNTDIAVRVYSVFQNPNILAEYLVMLIPLAVGVTWHTKSMRKKIVFTGATGLLLVCILLTLSRGGWVGIAFAALTFIILVDLRLLILAIPVGLGGLMFLPDQMLNRIISIGSTVDSSNSYRIKIWEITMNLIRDHKVGGVGFGYIPFKKTFETYIRTMPIYHAHNTYLEVAAEIGIAGLFIFMLFMLSTLKYAYINLVKSEDKYYKYIGAGLCASIVGIMAHGLVEHFLYIPRIIFTFWIIIGIIFTAIKVQKNEKIEIQN